MATSARSHRNGLGIGLWLVALLGFAGCEQQPEPPPPPSPPQDTAQGLNLTARDFAVLPGWGEDRLSESLPALRRSCKALTKPPPDKPVGPDGLAGAVADWQGPCQAIDRVPDGDDAGLRAVLIAHFAAFQVTDGAEAKGLFTGYYEAELKGSLTPAQGYDWPLYRRPDDLVSVDLKRFDADLSGRRLLGRTEGGKLVPYHSRAQIDAGALAGRGLEFLWVDDPVDAFFLHVQGSGRVTLPDGSARRVGFAGSNGLPFYAIGRALIDEGRVDRDKVSMQAIRDWLRANPDQAKEIMARNKRYIFFRLIEGEGPVGAQGVALTAGRSLAVDPKHLPLGAPLWLDTTWPASDRPLTRLVVAQDTGSAITGVLRGDLFWGFGEAALEQAGRMKQTGIYYLLLPKAVAERRRTTS
jgi:membrane-bound lytic murein transglycosylase A